MGILQSCLPCSPGFKSPQLYAEPALSNSGLLSDTLDYHHGLAWGRNLKIYLEIECKDDESTLLVLNVRGSTQCRINALDTPRMCILEIVINSKILGMVLRSLDKSQSYFLSLETQPSQKKSYVFCVYVMERTGSETCREVLQKSQKSPAYV